MAGTFLERVARIVGGSNLLVEGPEAEKYARTTSVRAARPMGVIRPGSREEVQEIVRAAGEFGVPLHPISRGKNWGYGDACPPTDGQMILDLGRMNRILEVHTKLAYAVIEPGVTQGQLYRHLVENKTGLWMDSTGAGLEASLVGNTVDRGFGHTRYGDHSATACGMEIVLADGRILNTGYGHFANSKAKYCYRYGIGPSLDGLFQQSNYGIVTKIGLWLMPAPEDFCAFFCFAEENAKLGDLVDKLAYLRMQGLLQATVHIGNDLRVFSSRTRYPWHLTGGATPLPDSVRAELRRKYAIGSWNVGSAIYGTKEMVAAARKSIARVLADYKPTFLNDRRMRSAERAIRIAGRFGALRGLGERLESVRPVYGLLKGIPTDEPLRGAAWRVRGEDSGKPQDPLDVHAGVMWVSPVVAADGESAREVMSILEPIYAKHRFEALVTFTLITERAMCCVTNISFDRREAKEMTAAGVCYEELMGALMGAGYVPYRGGAETMGKVREEGSTFWEVARQIKERLDPGGVISPGRYVSGG